MNEKENIDKFDDFKFHLAEIARNFIKRTRLKGYDLNYSEESIDLLEKYILDNNITVADDDYYDASCYLGELFINLYKGKWTLECNKKSVFYNKPIIEYDSPYCIVFSPFTTLRGVILRKKMHLLRKIIDNNINPTKKNINW